MSNDVLVFKVALKYAKRIWRRIAISEDDTLADLHEAIFDAFDRFEEHMYSFYFTAKPSSKSRSRLRDAQEYVHPDSPYGQSAADVPMRSLRPRPKLRFEYLFDYGDEWWHEITFEGTQPAVDGQVYPLVLDSRGESPPQYADPEE